MIRPLYTDVVANDMLAQDYLNSIKHQFPTTVSALVYDPSCKKALKHLDGLKNSGLMTPSEEKSVFEMKMSGDMYYALIGMSTRTIGKRDSCPIFLTRRCFDMGEEYMKFSIRHHEIFHINDIINGIKLPCTKIDYTNVDQFQYYTILCILEIRARQNEMEMFRREGVQIPKYRQIDEEIDYYKSELENIHPASELEEIAILDTL